MGEQIKRGEKWGKHSAFEYVLRKAEAVGGERKARLCKKQMEHAAYVLSTWDVDEIVPYLDDRAKSLHATVPSNTNVWTDDDWAVIATSNACSFAASKIVEFFGAYMKAGA
jgi:uncharacterized protein YozE (UPF0346 family)